MGAHDFSAWFFSSRNITFLTLCGIIIIGYGVALLIIRRYKRRNVLSAANMRFVRWLFIYLLLVLCGNWFQQLARIKILYHLLVFTEYLALWFTVKHFVDGFYADFYLNRIKGRTLSGITLDLIKFVALFLVVFAYLKFLFDININSILTSSVILTAVIGLSMQDTIGSLVSGLLIQIEKPFRLGDWINVGDLEGKVVEISWRYTKIETRDNNLIVIPNNSISRERLINYSAPDPVHRRRIFIGVAYDVPPIRVKEAIGAVLKGCRLVLSKPPPRVRVDAYGDSSIIYHIIFFIRQYEHHRNAIDEIYSGIWYEFKKRDIEIPFPVRTLIPVKKQAPEVKNNALELLHTIQLFEGMRAEELDTLLRFSDIRSYPPQTRIVVNGGVDTTFYVILSGRVAVRRADQLLAELTSGQFFGEMALLTGEPRSADVVALEQTQCLLIDREGFRVVLEQNPQVINNVNDIFSQRHSANRSASQTGTVIQEVHETLLSRFRRIFSI